MATAGTIELTTTAANLFTGVCSELTVYNDGTGEALINVLRLHATDEWFPIPSGESQAFTIEQMGLTQAQGKTAAGTADIRWGITAVEERGES